MGMEHLWLKVAGKLAHKRTNRSGCTTGPQLAFFLNEANDWSHHFL